MIYYDKIKVIGSDSSGRSIAVVSLWVDTAANLPAANAYQSDGFILGMGSEGNCIDSGDKYRLDSSGAWQISQAGTGTYTKAEIDAIVSRIDATEAEDRAALVEVENKGAKNLLKVSVVDAKVNTGNTGFTWAGNIASKNHVNFQINDDLTVDVSSDTGYTASDLTILYLTDGSGAYPNTILNGCPSGGSNTTYELRTATPVKSDYGSGVEITSDSTTNVVIIIRSGWSGELTFKPMICTKAEWDISQAYVPYAPTNRELYQMILAIQ